MEILPFKNAGPGQIRSVALTLLDPHPHNPRIIERADVVEAIATQLREAGEFDPAHAILARPVGDRLQIISGHNRVQAARVAGLAEVPAWVRSMDDETAFMQLVLANSQSELSALERGLHALAATDKGRHRNSVKGYAEAVGRNYQTVNREVQAARVAQVSTRVKTSDLLDYARHLSEIHSAPQDTWPVLVSALVERSWSVKDCKVIVADICGISDAIPEEHRKWMSVADLTAARLNDDGIHAQFVAYLASEVERSQRAYMQAANELDFDILEFRNWLERQDSRDVPEFPLDIRAAMDSLPRREVVLAAFQQINVEAVKAARSHKLAEIAAVTERVKRLIAERRATVTANQKRREDAERKARMIVTLTDWKALSAEAQATTMLGAGGGRDQFNKQDGDLIDWAQWSWNPVTGCLHDCSYCYARDIANRFYEHKFEPTLHPGRLAAPANTKVPPRAEQDIRYKNVFTGSMADLFGRWVPAEWIEAVLKAAINAPDWNFLFLTKFPQRMAEFQIPRNAWMGTTVDCQARVANAEKAFAKVACDVRWLSVEPLIEPLKFKRLDLFDWIVIGGASPSSQTPAWNPPLSWVEDLEAQADAVGCKVYRKPNLFAPRREMPWDTARPTPDRAPDSFHYLGRRQGEGA